MKDRVIIRERRGARPDAFLPGQLPAGERVIWQGGPAWRPLAVRALHLRAAALYLAALVLWCAVRVPGDATPLVAAVSTLWLAALGSCAIGTLASIGWLMARSARYTITDRRVVLRCGIALTASINLPYAMIDAASVALHRDGVGDIPLRLRPGQRVPWGMLWPFVRPWRFAQPEPMLRAVPDAQRVATLLAQALAASASQVPMPVAAMASAPASAIDGGRAPVEAAA